jgi:hypothetical protein
MKKPVERGTRLSIWLGESDSWMLRTIARIRTEAERKGVPTTQGMLIRLALEQFLRGRAVEEDFDER